MKKTLLIATALTTSAYTFSPGATHEAASLLESLPAEVQKHIEETRASCSKELSAVKTCERIRPLRTSCAHSRASV